VSRTHTRLDPDERREDILAAAIAEFRGTGYPTVSMDAIAERAGVTRGLLNHYFGSKRSLYLSVVERMVMVPDDLQLVPSGLSGDLHEAVAASVDRWMRLIEANGGFWVGVASSAASTDPDVAEVLVRASDRLVERMIDDFPFPEELDRTLLTAALRAYTGLARAATDEWLVRRSIGAPETKALLCSGLEAVVDRFVPEMARSRDH